MAVNCTSLLNFVENTTDVGLNRTGTDSNNIQVCSEGHHRKSNQS